MKNWSQLKQAQILQKVTDINFQSLLGVRNKIQIVCVKKLFVVLSTSDSFISNPVISSFAHSVSDH